MTPCLGEIRLFAGNYAPVGWALCNGSTLPINSNEALYALIATTYGGDGQTTFGLPNLNGRVPVNIGKGTGLANTYALGNIAGAESVTLQEANMPAHNHAVNAVNAAGNTNVPTNHYLAVPTDTSAASASLVMYLPDTAPGRTVQALDPNSLTAYPGGSQPHENRMPYVVMSYIIATEGIYPQPG